MSDVHVAFSLTKRDFVESSRAVFRCKLPMRALYLFLALAAVVALGANLIHRDYLRLGNLMVEVGAPLALMAILWFSPWLYVVQSLRNHTSAFGQQHWWLGSTGVRVETEHSKASFDWALVRSACEDSAFLLLFVSDWMAYPIPKRALGEDTLQALRTTLRQALGVRARCMS